VETAFSVNSLVEHPALGLGRTVAVQGELIHVYFHDKGGKCATKMRATDAKKLLRVASSQTHEWLDHLPPFSYDPKRALYCLEYDRLTHEQAVGKFLTMFPGGFDDVNYLGDRDEGERVYKDYYAGEFRRLLMGGEGARLLSVGDLAEFRKRLLHVAKINLLHFNWDQAPLKDALAADDAQVKNFFAALLDACGEGPSEKRFTALAGAFEKLPAPGSDVASWPVATLFPYLARPDDHMFFRPKPTQEAAKRLAFDLNYKSNLNWITYNSVLAFSKWLLGQLKQYGAKDLIDVQSFIFVTWIPNYTTKKATTP
jgi:hypothetical protein